MTFKFDSISQNYIRCPGQGLTVGNLYSTSSMWKELKIHKEIEIDSNSFIGQQ